MTFTEDAWQHTTRLQSAMLELPFNAELADGTLSRARFQFFLAQDARYLVGFGRALAVAAAKADDHDEVAFFAGSARQAILVERGLHQSYFDRFGLAERDLAEIETSPTCLGYTSYLLATALTGSYAELIAALLPCFWVYQNVGTRIHAMQGDRDNPYREWIDTYVDDSFGAAVAACKAAVDRVAENADERIRSQMLAAFARATEFEWLFWDSAYRQESWRTAGLRD